MSHRRLHSYSEIIPLSWENINNSQLKTREKPRISWENKPWTSKEVPRISWENTPWTSKDRPRISWDNNNSYKPRLSTDRSSRVVSELKEHRRSVYIPGGCPIPPPPCPFLPPGARSSPKKLAKKDDDPFLAAYLECTKSAKVVPPTTGIWFSCKRTCGVREDGMVRLSKVHEGPVRSRFIDKEVLGQTKGRRSSFF